MTEYCFSYLEITAIGVLSFITGLIIMAVCKN